MATTTPQRIGRFLLDELRPKGPVLTPFNVITLMIMATAAVILFFRFAYGLGATTNLSQAFPWGIWIGFDVVTGVAFAGGAYVLTFMVYIMRSEKYHSIIRITVLNGFLAYVFYAGALLLDLGRPWNVINPIIGNDFGVSSVLFLVAWHFLLYMTAELIEFSPAIAEWLGMRRLRRILKAMTLGAVIFGICLSLLHQSGLGALFLMAKPKIHPLWYSEFIPILFVVSSVFAGLSLVIIEGSISRRVFFDRMDAEHEKKHDGIVFGLARICAGAMFVYFFLVLLTHIHGQDWSYLSSSWGLWYLLEVVGLVLVPMVLYLRGLQKHSMGIIKLAAGLSLLGIVMNRLNVSVIAFKWYSPAHYIPNWMEIVVTAAVISAEIWVVRWIVRRMPVLSAMPKWAKKMDDDDEKAMASSKGGHS